jgi:hypothetical protein
MKQPNESPDIPASNRTGKFGCFHVVLAFLLALGVWGIAMLVFFEMNYPHTTREGANGMFICFAFIPIAIVTLPVCIGISVGLVALFTSLRQAMRKKR